MTKVIGVSGRKQSGKSSLCSYIQAYLAKSDFNQNKAGVSFSSDLCDLPPLDFSQDGEGHIKWFHEPDAVLSEEIVNYLKLRDRVNIYSFADYLKRICIDVLGLTYDQCYGSDEQKNELTHITWDSFPLFVRLTNSSERPRFVSARPDFINERDMLEFIAASGDIPFAECYGPMTARQVMQVFGTDIMRKMFFNRVWVNATFNMISHDKNDIAMISDVRFKSEVDPMYERESYIIRLERHIVEDTHSSEKDLDDYDFTNKPRTLIIPESVGLQEKNEMTIDWLIHQGVIQG